MDGKRSLSLWRAGRHPPRLLADREKWRGQARDKYTLLTIRPTERRFMLACRYASGRQQL
jgi:hypothetical protein